MHARERTMRASPAVLLPAALLLACASGADPGPGPTLPPVQDLAGRIRTAAELFLAGAPQASRVAHVLGGRLELSTGGDAGTVTGQGWKAILAPADDAGPGVGSLSIVYATESGLQMHHLSAVLGSWTLVAASKTSSVRFEYSRPDQPRAVPVFVELLLPPENASSPVIRVIIRKASPVDHCR